MRLKFKRLEKEEPLAMHNGIFRRRLSLFEGTALILSGTIGAGVLGIPYAIAQVGIVVGLVYIVVLGLLITGLNLLVGEIAVRTNEKLQLVGFVKKYIGKRSSYLLAFLLYIMLFSVMVVYIIGEGEAMSALFGGSSFYWSLIFTAVGSFLIFIGLKTIKTVELVLSLGILAVILFIAGASTPHISFSHLVYTDLAHILFPYGVILFAFHGTTSIPEAHSLLIKKEVTFKKAIILAGLISIAVYALFAFVVVGVTGLGTTEIATIGLGNAIGPTIFLLGNIFAILAMGTSFLMVGLSLRDSLEWDYKLPNKFATLVVCGVPLLIFLAGVRQFIAVIDVIGGVFVSLEMLFILFIYWKAKQSGHWLPGKYKLHYTTFIGMALLLALSFGAVYSVWKLF